MSNNMSYNRKHEYAIGVLFYIRKKCTVKIIYIPIIIFKA